MAQDTYKLLKNVATCVPDRLCMLSEWSDLNLNLSASWIPLYLMLHLWLDHTKMGCDGTDFD